MAKSKLTKEQKKLYEKLTSLQKQTANARIRGKSYAKAYLFAKKKIGGKIAKDRISAGEQILTNTNVKAYLDSVLIPKTEKDANNAIMERDECLEGLTATARGNLDDLIQFGERIMGQDEDGKDIIRITWWFKDSKSLTRANLAMIKEISAGKDGIKLKTHDPLKARSQLAEMQGWNAAKQFEVLNKDEELTPWSEITASVDS